MFCPKCGAQNPDNAAFCAGCGEKLQGAAPAVGIGAAAAAPATGGAAAAAAARAAANKKPFIVAVAAVVVVLAVVVFAFVSCSSGDQLKQGTYSLTTGSGDDQQTMQATVTAGNVVTANISINGQSVKASTTFVPAGTSDNNVIYDFGDSNMNVSGNGQSGSLTLAEGGDLTVDGEWQGAYTVQKAIAPKGGTEGHVVGKWGVAFQGPSNAVFLFDVRDDGTATMYSLSQEMPNPDQIFEVDQLLAAGAQSTEMNWEESEPGTYALWHAEYPESKITIKLP